MNRSIAKLASISLVGGLIGKGLRYGFNIIISRGLGTDALGLFAFGLVLLKAGGVISQLGLDRAVQKFVPVYNRQGDQKSLVGITIIGLSLPFVVGSGVALLLYVLTPLIQDMIGKEFAEIIHPFALGIPLYAVMMVAATETKAFKETKYFVYIRDLAQTCLATLFILGGSYVMSDLTVVILGYHLSLLFGVVLGLYFLYRLGALAWKRPNLNLRETLSFSLPLTVAAVSLFLITWTDILMLSAFATPTEVGWYQIAFQTSVLLLFILNACNSIFPTLASDMYHNGDFEGLDTIYTGLTKWIASLTVLGYIYIVVYDSTLLRVFGSVSPVATTALMILGFGQTITASSGPVGFLLTMSGHERIQTINALLASGLNVVLNWILIQHLGVVGAAIATATSFIFLNLIRLAESQYLLGINPFSRSYWTNGVGVLCAGTVIFLAEQFLPSSLPVAFAVGVISLGTFFTVAGLLGLDELDRALLRSLD